MKRGAATWTTSSGGGGEFANVVIALGKDEMLTSKMKIWGLTLNEHTQLQIGFVDNILSSSAVFEIAGPVTNHAETFEFPQANDYVILSAEADSGEPGSAVFQFAIIPQAA